MKYQGFFISFLLIMVMPLVWTQELVIRAELDTNRARIGDQVKLRLTVDKPVSLQVTFPVIKDTLSYAVEIISISGVDTVSQGEGKIMLNQELLIAAYDTGLFEIPALPFTILLNGKQDIVSSMPVFLEIVPVPLDSTIRDIKDVAKAPLNLAEVVYYVKKNYPYGLLALGLLILTWLLIRYFRKRKVQPDPMLRFIPDEPAEVIAMRELDKLKEDKPWTKNRVKHYYIKISEILRTYIEHRFRLMALEQTTDEIIRTLKTRVSQQEDLEKLSSVLKLADLVKFAKVIPEPDENAAQILIAVDFVQKTTQSPMDSNIQQNNQKG